MNKKIICYWMFLFALPNILGCAPLIIGTVAAVGAVGGYAVSKDTVQGETDRGYSSLWQSAVEVAKIRGTIVNDNPTTGYIELKADSSRVWIRLVRLTRATTRLRVSARKFRLPNLSLAQDIFVKIMEDVR